MIKEYNGVVFEDLETVFKVTNINYYKYVKDIGLDLDLSNKDQQKIYSHFFITNICRTIQNHKNLVVFHINSFNICDIHKKIIHEIRKIFGFHIWESPYPLDQFILNLKNRDVEVVDWFELFLDRRNKPKTFKHIKKYLDKEGFTQLSDTYFQDMVNKMSILC